MSDLAEEFEARAKTFRRVARELNNAADRAALIAIAEQYEAEATRLRAPRSES